MDHHPPKEPRRSGVILTEACVSIMLVGLVLTMVSLMLTRHAQSTDYFLNYRRAQLAAESCVERMRAGVLEVADAAFIDGAGVAYEIRVADANGPWEPLQRVSATASIVGSHGRIARYQLNTYVPPARSPAGGVR
ncbi:MAG: hypothetical protein AAB363_01885 [Planctomycetota bacterium]|jgi:Tfp pilus assembly protein PilV